MYDALGHLTAPTGGISAQPENITDAIAFTTAPLAKERISDTVKFFPTHTKMPHASSADNAMIAAKELTAALLHPAPAAPFAHIGDAQLKAIRTLAEIFQRTIDTAKPPPRVPIALHNHKKNTPTPVLHPIPPHEQPPSPIHPHLIPNDHEASPRVIPITPTNHRYPTRQSQQANSVIIPPMPQPLFHSFANSVIDEVTGQVEEYRHLIKGANSKIWENSFANKIGRLTQGVGTRMPTGTNTIFFIPKKAVPTDRKVTYGRICVNIRPQKTEPHRTRLTVGGNLIEYPDDVSTPTADLTTAKLLFNSVISTPGAKFLTADIKDFYLNTEMARYEYMRLAIHLIPQEIIDQYDLLPLVDDGYIYMEIRKGMYGLP
jgi:hypothetical protein